MTRDLFFRDFELSRVSKIDSGIVIDYIYYIIFAVLLKSAIYIYISCAGMIWGVSRLNGGSFSYENCTEIICNISLDLEEAFFFSISQGIGGASKFFPLEISAQMGASFVSMMGLFVTSIILLFALNVRHLIGMSAESLGN